MRFRLLQWNILFAEHAENVLRVLKDIGADILCLQEVIRDEGDTKLEIPTYLAQELGLELRYQAAHTWHNPGGIRQIGNAILSRFPIIDSTWQPVHTAVPEATDPSAEGRIYLEAVIDVGQPLHVSTAHLSVKKGFIDNLESTREDDRLLEIARRHTRPYILTGDFNHTPASRLVTELSRILRHCGPDFSIPTWPTIPAHYPDLKIDLLSHRIDYAFASDDIAVVQAEAPDVTASDHRPILLTLEV